MANKQKLTTLVQLGIAILSLASIVLAETNSVTGTSHDLTINPEIIGSLGTCGYCHGAHSTIPQLPLWERTGTVSLFTLYASITIKSDVEQPGSTSLACLSCHDGVTAFDAVNGSTGTAGNDMSTHYEGSSAIMGIDLRNEHPIGVSIAVDTAGIRDETTITNAGLKIYDGKVECASCHDAHGSAGFIPFLRLEQDNSLMCLTCHIK